MPHLKINPVNKLTTAVLIACLLFINLFSLSPFFTRNAYAQDETLCPNRYLTLINPVRGRDLWHNKTLLPISGQYEVIKKNGLAATWLIQYDVLFDSELMQEIRSFSADQEKGVFLEISKKLANDSRVVYPLNTPWFRPNAVFLSGYSPSERLKLIDTIFHNFKKQFGYYPKSVGAWWVDSYSLDYLRKKYQISSALIVADQLTTDNYGVWGQWWGVPYYPSKANVLVPARNNGDKQNVVVMQWAQRDPLRAYGEGPAISNFSLQANDYIRQGQTTDYFKQISENYLSCANNLGQITVGLETGIESIGYLNEYANQLEYLKNRPGLKAVTMSEFAKEFSRVYPEVPEKNVISNLDSEWVLTPEKRENKKLNDIVVYAQNISFSDYFISDNSEFLNRNLNNLKQIRTRLFIPYYLGIILIAGFFYYKKKRLSLFIFALLFLFSAYGLLLRSFSQYGWIIFYGAAVNYLQIFQSLICLAIFLVFDRLVKTGAGRYLKNTLFLSLLSLSFGVDYLISLLRFTVLENKYYVGLALDALRFIGLSISRNLQVQFINKDFEGYQLAAFLKIDSGKIWQNGLTALILYPLIHIVAAWILFLFLNKLNSKVRKIIIVLLVLLWIGYVYQLLTADPRIVMPNT